MQRLGTMQRLGAAARDGLLEEIRLWASVSLEGTWWTRPGVVASISPATPDRSLFNGVLPESLAALRAHYDELFGAYRAAGVRAFTVWTEPGDDTTGAWLASRGHVLDASPRKMAARPDDLELPAVGDLDWEESEDIAAVARLNDAAYGDPRPAFAAACRRFPEQPGWRVYLARQGGAVVSGLLTFTSESGNSAVTAVATLVEARGRGIATRLLAQALRDARAAGASTTSLESTSKGLRVYERLGYRDLGAMGMWEHRVPRS